MNKKLRYILFITLALGVALSFFLVTQNDNRAPETITKEPEVAAQNTLKIIAFGDSLTAGYGVSQNEAYPAQLEVLLEDAGYQVSVLNAGVSGETTRGNLERANFIRSQNPDIVIVGIGGNDALRALPIEETRKNIIETLRILKSDEGAPHILLLEMQAPLNAGTEYKTEFDSLFQTIARDEELTLIPFITPEIFLDTANKISDGIHYNKQGYARVVTQYILPELLTVLDGRADINNYKSF